MTRDYGPGRIVPARLVWARDIGVVRTLSASQAIAVVGLVRHRPMRDALSAMDEQARERTANGGVSGAADTWPLSAREAAAALGVSERTIRRAIARGDFPAVKHAGLYRIARADLECYRASLRLPTPLPTSTPTAAPRLLPFPEQSETSEVSLSRPLTPLVGRELEVAAVRALVLRDDVRLVTLTGPGGVGKTRVAVQIAAELADAFADGAAFVSLAAVREPDLVGSTIASALGVVQDGGRTPAERLGRALRARQLLLVLDNFEQVLAAAPLVTDLLGRCPRLVVLVTSRVVLRLEGEQVFPVPPLAVPDAERPPIVEQLAEVAAVRLFVERARAADPAFSLSDGNAGAVAAVCHRLDGLPLAIELAAARIALLPPEAILPRLAKRLPLLTGGRRDAPARHWTMRDAIGWSHDLLSNEEQALFRRLAVFVGGFTLEAAEAVMAEGGGRKAEEDRAPSAPVLDGVAALVDASLLRQEPGSASAHRFSMLETVREYGLERLAEAGEETAARDAHAAFFVVWDERLDPNLTGPDERVEDRLWRIETEHPNLRGALSHMAARGDAAGVLRLAGALAVFWHHRGHLAEGRQWLEWALVHTPDSPTVRRGRALAGLSLVVWAQGDNELAGSLAGAGLSVAQNVGDEELIALAIHLLGIVELVEDRLDRARGLMEEALGRWRALGSSSDGSMALMVLSQIAQRSGDTDLAVSRAEEALANFRRLGHPNGAAGALSVLARVALERGDEDRALMNYHEILLLWLGVDARYDSSNALGGTTRTPIFPRWASVDDRGWVVLALAGLAGIGAAHGQPETAAVLTGAVDLRRDEIGIPIYATDRAQQDRTAEAVRTALGEERFAELRAAGREMALGAAIAVALAVETDVGPTVASWPGHEDRGAGALTPREHEVLRLLVEGRSNAEIADALFVGVRTVRGHVANILAKLGVATRTAAATHAVRQGLI